VFFRMGNYRHAVAELELISTRQTTKDQAGRPVFYTDRWQLAGQLQAEGALLLLAQDALMRAYREEVVKNCSLAGLYYDSGIATVYNWNAFNTIGGFRVVSGPDFQRGDGQQWVNCRDYTIVLEADFPALMASNTMEWRESLTITGGGGQRLVGVETRYGRPIIQRTSRWSPVMYNQEGRALGRYFYPKPPPAIFRGDMNSPNCRGRKVTPNLNVAGAYGTQTDWEITWSYEMILDRFIDAGPTRWNGS